MQSTRRRSDWPACIRQKSLLDASLSSSAVTDDAVSLLLLDHVVAADAAGRVHLLSLIIAHCSPITASSSGIAVL